MVLVETGKFNTFEQYIASLSKKARKNYKYAKKHNENVVYEEVPFSREEVKHWMELWERQLIKGQYKRWAFPVEALEGKNIKCFRATEGEPIAFQFVEETDGYVNCHPVMYEKDRYSSRYLSKFMWFSLMGWAIAHASIVDLGGGIDESWREMIKRREEFPNPLYKWIYVPREVKDNPDKQVDYKVEQDGISKRISKNTGNTTS